MCVLGLVLFGIVLSTVSVYPEEDLPADSVATDAPRFTMATQVPYKRAMLWVVIDVLALAMAYYAAFLLRYGQTDGWADQFSLFVRTAPTGVACLLVGVSVFGLYRTDWQSFSLHEAKAIVKGVTGGTVAQGLLIAFAFGQGLGAVEVSVVSWGAALLALTGSRGVVRALADSLRRGHTRGQRVLVYGAGAGGELVLRELRANSAHDMHVVGFIDDDPSRRRTLLHGVAVLGTGDDAARLVRDCDVAAVVVATRKVPEERIARLVQDVGAVGGAVYQFTFRLEPLADADAPQVLTPAAAPPAPAPARRASMLSPRGPATEPMPDAASSVPTT
jgi:UDP-GlcNAc:undecaprenyl-phosphate GlcNAc-1-phosphate transferase